MSLRCWKLDTPTTFDRVHVVSVTVQEDGSALAHVRYSLSMSIVEDTDEGVVISSEDLESWQGDWDPETHAWEEHVLEKIVTQESLPAGALESIWA